MLAVGRGRPRLAELDGGHGPLRRLPFLSNLPFLALLCLTPLFLAMAATGGRASTAEARPLSAPASPVIEKLLELRHSLIASPEPVFPAPPGYRLPWPAGLSRAVAQSPGEEPTHQSLQAWDFGLDYELVLAARGGRVSMVRAGERMGGCDSAFGGHANYVLIDHGDGTSALYLHIEYVGARVREGALVSRGDAIAYSGSTGLSCGDGGWAGPHLHFQVQRTVPGEWWTETIPITFDDLKGSVPATGGSYVSGNLPPSLVKRSLVAKFPLREARGVEVYVPPSRSFLAQRTRLLAETPQPVAAAMATPAPTPTPRPTPTPAPAWWFEVPEPPDLPVPRNPAPPAEPSEIPILSNPPPAPATPAATPTPTD